jgi:hypothetical protein
VGQVAASGAAGAAARAPAPAAFRAVAVRLSEDCIGAPGVAHLRHPFGGTPRASLVITGLLQHIPVIVAIVVHVRRPRRACRFYIVKTGRRHGM